ncbi:MAG: DNA-3-methyladenine glycosylase I [Candidatus Moranbacteria bacterium]|nr:DNA-3-methyladenine glycosylase I [Candidatus Moranbacteria bacterium]
MSMICSSCSKSIDSDSFYCKYCGVKVHLEYSTKPLSYGDIFNKIHSTLRETTKLSNTEFEAKFGIYKMYENRSLTDDQYYSILVDVIFYSGFKAATVDKYIKNIHNHFPSIDVVIKYTESDLIDIANDSNIIQNQSKIRACFKNALVMHEIIQKHESFSSYVDFMNPNKDEKSLYNFKHALERQFHFLGGITSFHFMTDIGLNVIKPDRVIIRIFKRLSLIEHDKDILKAIEIGRQMSKSTGYPIRYIDVILVLYGQLNHLGIVSICTEVNPKCELCKLKQNCSYYMSKEERA